MINIEISVLGSSNALVFDSQQELFKILRPGKNGLILQEGSARGTFLPAVWESLPEPEEFLAQLKIKSGLTADYWSDSIEVRRYTTESFGAQVSEIRKAEEHLIKTE